MTNHKFQLQNTNPNYKSQIPNLTAVRQAPNHKSISPLRTLRPLRETQLQTMNSQLKLSYPLLLCTSRLCYCLYTQLCFLLRPY